MSLPTAPITGPDAIATAASRIGGTMANGSGYCLQFVRENYAVPAYYASAIDAWNAATEQHPGDDDPPPSAPVWFRSSSPYRHVAFHLGDGRYATTFNADIRDLSFDQMLSSFGPLIGWAPDLNEFSLRPPGTTPPGPQPEEDNVVVMVKWADTAPWFATDWLTKRLLADGDPEMMRDLGIITPEAYALGARYVPRDKIDAIPDAG